MVAVGSGSKSRERDGVFSTNSTIEKWFFPCLVQVASQTFLVFSAVIAVDYYCCAAGVSVPLSQ